LNIRRTLADQDKSNAGWQRILSVSYNKFADVLVAQGKRQEALDAYQQSLNSGPTIPPLAPGDRADTGFIRVAVAPDGTLIAGANLDGKICIWDTKKGDQVARFTSHGIYLN
jgi:WD40 repeat protein